jgi:hypothetical protein
MFIKKQGFEKCRDANTFIPFINARMEQLPTLVLEKSRDKKCLASVVASII